MWKEHVIEFVLIVIKFDLNNEQTFFSQKCIDFMPKKENGFHLTQTLKIITLRLLLNSLTCYEIHVEKCFWSNIPILHGNPQNILKVQSKNLTVLQKSVTFNVIHVAGHGILVHLKIQ